VLGRVVEVLRGTTYAGALRRHLADPLDVDGLAFDAGEALAHRTAIGHVRGEPGEPWRPLRTWAVMPHSNPAAGNQAAMPARGLIALARLHLADGLAPDGTRLLSSQSARLMREPHVDVPATWGQPVRQGLGWRLMPATGLVEHGGDAIGCGAMLRLAPDRGVAVAVLGNGGDVAGLVAELCDELLEELAGVAPRPRHRVPGGAPVHDLARYVGRYELRNQVGEVTSDDAGRLWLMKSERNEAATMAALAGVTLEPGTSELRRLDGDRFLQVTRDGRAAGVVEFIDADFAGRARYLHSGRAAPRVA
jgi:CubicO group peptidase (beta-lactamase class C family)